MDDVDWRSALSKFIAPWEGRKDVVGALVCGSYVTGDPSRHSDIDVQIPLDRNTRWRERGNRIIDGFLIEYFANPLPQNLRYHEKDHLDRDRVNIHMFLTGEVIFDKNGDVKTESGQEEVQEARQGQEGALQILSLGHEGQSGGRL